VGTRNVFSGEYWAYSARLLTRGAKARLRKFPRVVSTLSPVPLYGRGAHGKPSLQYFQLQLKLYSKTTVFLVMFRTKLMCVSSVCSGTKRFSDSWFVKICKIVEFAVLINSCIRTNATWFMTVSYQMIWSILGFVGLLCKKPGFVCYDS
jgi:hypothetical protein